MPIAIPLFFLPDQGPLNQHFPAGLFGFQSTPVQLALLMQADWQASRVSAVFSWPFKTFVLSSLVQLGVQVPTALATRLKHLARCYHLFPIEIKQQCCSEIVHWKHNQAHFKNSKTSTSIYFSPVVRQPLELATRNSAMAETPREAWYFFE